MSTTPVVLNFPWRYVAYFGLGWFFASASIVAFMISFRISRRASVGVAVWVNKIMSIVFPVLVLSGLASQLVTYYSGMVSVYDGTHRLFSISLVAFGALTLYLVVFRVLAKDIWTLKGAR